MKRYLVLGSVTLILGVVGGVGLAGLTSRGNHFEPSNAENPMRVTIGSNQTSLDLGTPRPKAVVVNGERHNFGSMRRGKEMQHTFYIRNTGRAPLRIEQRETTCKCTISKLDQNEIPPDGTAAVTLQWHAEGNDQNFRQTAIIWTNDPEREFVHLRIEGLVEDTIRIVPPELRFVNLSANDPATREFRIYGSKAVEELSIVEYELTYKRTAEFFDLQIRDLTPEELAENPAAKLGSLVSVNIKPGLPTGDINQTIRIKTSLPEAPDFYVQIAGNVISDISVLGRKFDARTGVLVLGGVEQASGAEAELLILVKGPEKDNVQIEVAEIDPIDGLEATLVERKASDKRVTYTLTVRVPPGAPRMTRLGSEQGKLGHILLRTSHSVTKEIPIYVKFSIN